MPRALFLDIHCDPCHRAAGGDPEWLRAAPRLARFSRDPAGGPVYAEPFKGKGPWRPPHPPPFGHQPGGRAFPRCHKRPDGGWTWDLSCPDGHYKPIQEGRIVAAFEAFPPGQDTWRISL
jgi:hypothetical protein